MRGAQDILGHHFEFPRPPQRVVSLVPSLTETLFALGADDEVAGITDFCIFPAGIDRPRVGGTKTPSVERIRALEPDLVYVNLEENLRRHAEAIEAFAPVFATEPKTIEDVAWLISTLGAIHGREMRAAELRKELTAADKGARRHPFTFAVPIWKDPWKWCGGDTYVSNLVESAGGRNVLHDRQRYPSIALEDVLAMKPDIVFLPDEPYAFTEADAAEIRKAPRPSAAAAEGGGPPPRIIGPFPGHLFTWHGARTIEGLRFLSRSL